MGVLGDIDAEIDHVGNTSRMIFAALCSTWSTHVALLEVKADGLSNQSTIGIELWRQSPYSSQCYRTNKLSTAPTPL